MVNTYTASEMEQLWRQVTGLVPLRADCRVERTDGPDLSAIVRARMRRWYLRLLREAPWELVGLTDVADRVSLAIPPEPERPYVPLPPEVVRPHSLMLRGWARPARVIAAGADPVGLALAANPYGACGPAGDYAPAVFLRPDGCLELPGPLAPRLGPDTEQRVASLLAVTDPGEDLYIFNPAAIDIYPFTQQQ